MATLADRQRQRKLRTALRQRRDQDPGKRLSQHVAELIEYRIDQGEMSGLMPTAEKMAADLDVSGATMTDARKILLTRRRIRVSGSQTFVVEKRSKKR